jgi:hypothetical protein
MYLISRLEAQQRSLLSNLTPRAVHGMLPTCERQCSVHGLRMFGLPRLKAWTYQVQRRIYPNSVQIRKSHAGESPRGFKM